MTDVTVRDGRAVNTPSMILSTGTHVEQRRRALALIDSFDAVEPDGLVSVSVVVDGLLDLRNVVEGADRLVVDALLGSVPGVNVVESNWWLRQLDGLRDVFGDDASEVQR